MKNPGLELLEEEEILIEEEEEEDDWAIGLVELFGALLLICCLAICAGFIFSPLYLPFSSPDTF